MGHITVSVNQSQTSFGVSLGSGIKDYINGQCSMTNMTAMSIYFVNLKIF